MNATCVSTALILPFVLAGIAGAQCAPIQDADQARLIDYVQKKYKTPATMRLEVADVAFVGSTCYRKLAFKAQDPRTFFRLELFAAPDLRFLTRELLDSTVDPTVEDRHKAEALAAGLVRGDVPVRGRADAAVTMVVFSDFQCPYCAGFASTMKDVMSTEADKLRLAFHYFPLPMHPWARPAAEAAACAQQQGNAFFWAFHDFLFEHQKDLAPDTLHPKLAEFTRGLAGFDEGKFAMCVVERKTAAQIDQDIAFAQQNGTNATPTAFLNGQKTQVAAPEQVRTLIRQLDGAPAAGGAGARPNR